MILASQSSADRGNLAPTTERLVNCYMVPAPEGSVAGWAIRSVPSMRDFSSVPGPFLRAMARVEEQLYVVGAGGLYLVRSDGTTAYLAAIPDDPNTVIVGHRDAVTITAGGAYYVWDGAALTQPAGGTTATQGSVAFLDQFTLMAELGGRMIEWTTVGDPTTRNGLYFATAEARDDDIIRIIEAGPYLAVMKRHSAELWASTGLGGTRAFERLSGAVMEKGLLAFNLVARLPDEVFYIGEDHVAYVGSPTGAARVSPPHVTAAIRDGQPTHCFYYEDRGHQFCVIRFADRPAWVFDAATGKWHERSTGTEHGPWDVVAAVKCFGEWHFADRLGAIFRVGATPVDSQAPLRRTIVTQPIYSDGKRFTISLLELTGLFGQYSVEETAPDWITDEMGFPRTDEDGQYLLGDAVPVDTYQRPGRLWARVSSDGGFTWGVPRVKEIGGLGQYATQVEFRSMGQFRHFTMEINITDPVDVPLLSEANVVLS